jgi:Flp pilus assembly protein TadD
MKRWIICTSFLFLVYSCSLFKTAPKELPPEEPKPTPEQILAEAENYVVDGISYYNAGNDSMAVQAWTKALEMIPQDAEVHNFLGVSLHRMGKIDVALHAFEKAIAFDPEYYQALNNQGYMLFLLNRYDEAKGSFQKSLAANSDYEPAAKNLKLLETIVSGQLDRNAFELSEEAAREDDYTGQIIKYGKVLELDSTYAKAHNNIAVAYYYEGLIDSAYLHLEHALKINKEYPEAINNLGYLYKVDENYELAIKLFLKALSLKPRYTGALNNLGETYTLKKEFENAIRVFTTVLDIDPGNEVAEQWLTVLNVDLEN